MSITFSKSARMYILEVFDMGVNYDGYIINTKTKEEVLCHDGKHIHIDEFAGICKGFGLVRDDFCDIVELSDYVKEQKEKGK